MVIYVVGGKRLQEKGAEKRDVSIVGVEVGTEYEMAINR
jgi:hypothetical protein